MTKNEACNKGVLKVSWGENNPVLGRVRCPQRVPRVCPESPLNSYRSRTGLSSWVTGLNFSGSSGVLSAGARGWWEPATPRCHLVPSPQTPDTHTRRGWGKPPYSRVFRSKLVFKEMSFEGKEPRRTSWIAGSKKPTFCSCPRVPWPKETPRAASTTSEAGEHARPSPGINLPLSS